MREPKLDTDVQQNFNAKADAVNREINPNILPQMFASNEIIESTISEKIVETARWTKNYFAVKIEPKLDAYFRIENDETFFDDLNVSHKQHPSPSKKYYTMYAKKTKLHKSKCIPSQESRTKTTTI